MSSELPAVREFSAQHAILHSTSTDTEDFLLGIERALRLETEKKEKFPWETRSDRIRQLGVVPGSDELIDRGEDASGRGR